MDDKTVDQVLTRSAGICEARFSPACTGYGTQLHHRKLRSRGGKDTVANLVSVCHLCHGHIHGEVKQATALGLIVSTWADPEQVPLVRRGYAVFHYDDGSLMVEKGGAA